MYPDLGPVRVYPVLYLAGVVLHFFLAYAFARRLGAGRGWWWDVGLSYAISMTVGARVLFDVTHGLNVTPAMLASSAYYVRGGLWGGPMAHLVPEEFARGGAAERLAVVPLTVSQLVCLGAAALAGGVLFSQFRRAPRRSPVNVAEHA